MMLEANGQEFLFQLCTALPRRLYFPGRLELADTVYIIEREGEYPTPVYPSVVTLAKVYMSFIIL